MTSKENWLRFVFQSAVVTLNQETMLTKAFFFSIKRVSKCKCDFESEVMVTPIRLPNEISVLVGQISSTESLTDPPSCTQRGKQSY